MKVLQLWGRLCDAPCPRPVMPRIVSQRDLSLPTCVPNSGYCIVPAALNALKAPDSTNLQQECSQHLTQNMTDFW